MSEPVPLSERINTTLSSVPEKASVVWKNRPRTYYSTYRPPDGVRYGTAPWYMQYFDKMYGQKKEKKSVFENPWLWVLGGVGLLGFFLYKNKKDTTTTTDPTSGGGISETVIGTDDTSDIPLISDYLTQETQTPNTGYTTPVTYPSFVPTGKQDGAQTEYTTAEQYRQQLIQTFADAGITFGAPIQVADADTSFVPYVSPEAKAQAEAPKSNAVAALEQAISGKTQTYTKEQTAAAMQTMMQNAQAPAYSGYIAPQKSAVSPYDTVKTVANVLATTAATANPIGLVTVAGNAAVNLAKSAVSALTSATQTKQTSTPKTTPTAKKTTTSTTPTKTPTFTVKSATSALNSAKNSKTTGKSNEKPRGYGVVH